MMMMMMMDLHAKYSAHVQLCLLPRAQVSVVLCGKGLLACSTKHFLVYTKLKRRCSLTIRDLSSMQLSSSEKRYY